MQIWKSLAKLFGKRGKLEIVWTYDAGAKVFSPPTIADLDEDGFPEIIFGT